MKRIMSAIAAATLALTLAACSDDADTNGTSATEEGGQTAEGFLATDLSDIDKVDEIAAMVPEDRKSVV